MKRIIKENKCTYVKPVCRMFYLESQAILVSSVTSSTDNEDVSNDTDNPWYTGQD
ncbi:MAG: hypothetical protein HXL33_07525 [Prevotellaceae bacterium]|nr:hypothetical protein [Prevotellaceae bacterium]MBF1074255.1 hypothetical protein [Prevotellaceae bacterium]